LARLCSKTGGLPLAMRQSGLLPQAGNCQNHGFGQVLQLPAQITQFHRLKREVSRRIKLISFGRNYLENQSGKGQTLSGRP